jgi:hypothetical protein
LTEFFETFGTSFASNEQKKQKNRENEEIYRNPIDDRLHPDCHGAAIQRAMPSE